jgi:hypothetical protein
VIPPLQEAGSVLTTFQGGVVTGDSHTKGVGISTNNLPGGLLLVGLCSASSFEGKIKVTPPFGRGNIRAFALRVDIDIRTLNLKYQFISCLFIHLCSMT